MGNTRRVAALVTLAALVSAAGPSPRGAEARLKRLARGSVAADAVSAALATERRRDATAAERAKAWCDAEEAAPSDSRLAKELAEACRLARARWYLAARTSEAPGPVEASRRKATRAQLPFGAVAAALKALRKGCGEGYGPACGDLAALGRLHPMSLNGDATLAAARKGCTLGDAPACATLAVILARGKLTLRNLQAARRHFDEACDWGDARACAGLGYLREHGLGVSRSTSRARRRYDEACDAGWGLACSNLGVLRSREGASRRDLARAAESFEKACRLGWPDACERWAERFGDADPARAQRWRAWACDAGHAVACRRLAASDDQAASRLKQACEGPEHRVLPRAGPDGAAWRPGVVEGALLMRTAVRETDGEACRLLAERRLPDDDVAAFHVLADGCGRQLPVACRAAGDWLRTGRHGKTDQLAALGKYVAGCRLGDAPSCARAGYQHLHELGAPNGGAQALPWLGRACDAGDLDGCSWLADAWAAGAGVEPDTGRAVRIYRRACERGHPRSCAELGRRRLEGDGVRKDRSRARNLLKLACDGGSDAGCRMLREMD